ncbi:aconitase iron-sulfur domain-containing protein [Aspergillus keveii]|uniref:Aconitase iron-sulfur domain-containing protein n=1 Tax=Aspergillus keveii TaxID=714993 RepID=A0ABR4GE86_9EURO
MSTASISICFLDPLPEYILNFVDEVATTLTDTRGIVVAQRPVGQPSQQSSARLILASSANTKNYSPLVQGLDDFLTNLSTALNSIGRHDEAASVRHVFDLCRTPADRGGLGCITSDDGSKQWPNSLVQLQSVQALIEAWLEALNGSESATKLPPPLAIRAAGVGPMTLAEKILAQHAFSLHSPQGLKTGELVRVSVDWVVASELSWVGMKHSMTSIGEEPTVWRNDRFWLAGDHTVDPRTYDQPRVRELMEGMQDAKTRFKMTENQGSNYTILHTEFVRERAEAGMLVIGSDSHTCSAGAVSSLAIGLGAADVMAALATGQTWFKSPESIRVTFTGEPAWYIRGKDVILYILSMLKRNTHAADRIVEFGGPGAEHLSCDARFAICNMCTELGAITGIFVPDEVTHRFVSERRHARYRSNSMYFQPDTDASYAATFEINLGNVESLVALYPSPDNVVPVTETLGMSLDGCFIGACTTTEEDLVLAALVLEAGLNQGLQLAPGKRMVVPGSLPIVSNLRDLGLFEIFIDAGFEQPAVSCSLCLGMGADRAGNGETWLSSQNRNFKNRMGQGSIGHICSAAVVAASSFDMRVTDPRPLLSQISTERYQTLLEKCRQTKRSSVAASRQPAKIASQQIRPVSPMPAYVEPCLSVQPTPASATHPRYKEDQPPKSQTNSDSIISKLYALGDFVDTDAIIPAAFILNSPTDALLGSHCLEFTNPDFRDQVRSGLEVVVAGKAFGCGSSREEAPRALKGLGVKCVIARSFAFIYGRNQPTIGLLGITINDDLFYEAAQTGTPIEINPSARVVTIAGLSFPFEMDDMELALIRRSGLAAAYKTFKKGVFESLCADVPRSTATGYGYEGDRAGLERGKGKVKRVGTGLAW